MQVEAGASAPDTVGQEGQSNQSQAAPQSSQAPTAAVKTEAGDHDGDTDRPVIIPQASLKRIKSQQRLREKREALVELASEFGFSSVEALQAFLRKQGEHVPATKDEPAPSANGQDQAEAVLKKFEKERAQLAKEKQEAEERARLEAKRRRRLQRERDALEAEATIRQAAVEAGIKDVAYGMNLLARSLKGKPVSELSKFDERKFFQGLRESHPYLFGEVVKPATTGNGKGAPPAPQPGTATTSAAQGNQVDVRKMSPEQFRDHLRSRGMNIQV